MLNNLVSSILVPILDAAAKDEAQKYAGNYSHIHATGNSSITLVIDENPGLAVTSWRNNGVNMLQTVMALYNAPTPADVSVRLYYSDLEYPTKSGSTFVGFRAVMQNLAANNATAPFDGPFTRACDSWQLIDAIPYGNVGLDEFLFEVNRHGDVVSIQPRALRVTLTKD